MLEHNQSNQIVVPLQWYNKYSLLIYLGGTIGDTLYSRVIGTLVCLGQRCMWLNTYTNGLYEIEFFTWLKLPTKLNN